MRFSSILFIALLLTVARSLADGAQEASERRILPPRSKYLLLDSRVIDIVENARLAVGTVKKHPANPLFGEELPWEVRFDNLYANVLHDAEEGFYKCWYSPFIVDPAYETVPRDQREPGMYIPALRSTGRDRTMGVAYATSRDGISWEKPKMDVRLWNKTEKTNLVEIGPHGAGVFKDAHDSDPKRRYKMFFKEGNDVCVAFSSDGIRWSEPVPCPEIDAAADTHNNAIWVPELNRYTGITRLWEGGQRVVGGTESADFLKWTKAREVLRGSPELQVYAMPVFRYADVYLGLPVIFNPKTDRSHTELAWSPDTLTWHRIEPGTPLIPTGSDRNDYDWGCVYAADAPVVLEDEIRLYYGASNGAHTDWRDGFLALATLPVDGFAGYVPADAAKPALVRSRIVQPTGADLYVSGDVGGLRIRVLDETGKPLAKSAPLSGNLIDRKVTFPEDTDIAARPVRFEFEWNAGRLDSFAIR